MTASNDRPRDFVFVRDAARACLVLADRVNQAGHSLDHTFQSGWEFSDQAMAGLIARRLAGPVDALHQVKLDDLLGWHPETRLNDALAETIEWYRQNAITTPTSTSFPARRAA